VSTKAKLAALTASAGVLAAGWAIGTANGQAATATDQSGTTTGSSQTTTGTTTSAATKAATTAKAASGAYKDGSYTGTTASHRYGSVTVTVKISGGKISDVTANVVDDGDRKSKSINSQAIPMIKSAVLSANSYKVSTIGGATYTTGAYLTSLQSALSKAGA
jgi:uncharacterized protein with FMN-binding domain